MSIEPIKEYLRESIGLDHKTIGTSIVESAIKKHMKQLDADDERSYLSSLKASPVKTKELIEMVVVNETWFFRQPEAFTCLTKAVTGMRKQLSVLKKLRILCLGCSTGEEPYSIAIQLRNMGIDSDLFMIDAVDISENALKIAESAIYRDSSFDKNGDTSFRANHFTKAGNSYQLNSDISKCVNFIHGNILHQTCPLTSPEYDIIFCRHVTIYLCDGAREMLLKRLNTLLAPDGTVFLGASEASFLRNNNYSICNPPAAFAFRKQMPEADITHQPSPSAPPARAKRTSRPETSVVSRSIQVETEQDESEPLPEYCWLINGISGNRSCSKLKQYIRCYNCPVRIEHGRRFLDRESTADYIEEWKENLAEEQAPPVASNRDHIVIFRLSNKLFGLPSLRVKDIAGLVDIHSVPYKSNDVLLGMASFSGELRLCVSLNSLLNVPYSDDTPKNERGTYRRMITLEGKGETWSFPVDEVTQIKDIYEADLTPASENTNNEATYSRGTAEVNEQPVEILDPELLLASLKRRIQ